MSDQDEHPEVTPGLPVKPLTADEQHDRNKEVAWYAALVNAYIATKMEVDRQLLSISIALLGAMVVALTQAALTAEWQVWLLGVSTVLIFVSMACLIKALDLNGDHVAAVKDDKPEQEASGAKLQILDKVARVALYAGVGIALLVAWQLGWTKAKHAEYENFRRQEAHERSGSQDYRDGQDRKHERECDDGPCHGHQAPCAAASYGNHAAATATDEER